MPVTNAKLERMLIAYERKTTESTYQKPTCIKKKVVVLQNAKSYFENKTGLYAISDIQTFLDELRVLVFLINLPSSIDLLHSQVPIYKIFPVSPTVSKNGTSMQRKSRYSLPPSLFPVFFKVFQSLPFVAHCQIGKIQIAKNSGLAFNKPFHSKLLQDRLKGHCRFVEFSRPV
jgi:hypothetical protein